MPTREIERIAESYGIDPRKMTDEEEERIRGMIDNGFVLDSNQISTTSEPAPAPPGYSPHPACKPPFAVSCEPPSISNL